LTLAAESAALARQLGPNTACVPSGPDDCEMSSETLGKLSYQAAIRALDVQERGVEQLRSRTGTLLGASSLTASFLGAQTIRRTSGVGMLGALALCSLGASIVLCVFVLLPRSELVFSVSGTLMLEALGGAEVDDEEIHRSLVYWLDGYWSSNETQIEHLGRYFFAASVSLALQLALWAWALAATIS
jgi:hypothetical protein